MYLTPAHRMLLRPQRPIVKVQDVLSNITDLTTYTFASANIGDLGTAMNVAQTVGTDQVMRSASNRAIVVICHSEAAAITWTVSTCTIGGVAGFKLIDRGGGTTPINTASFIWPARTLGGITNTNVVVTHSKAVTSCAIGVLSVENILLARTSGFATTFGSTAPAGAAHSGSGTLTLNDAYFGCTMIVGSTCDTGSGAETVRFQARPDGTQTPGSYQPLTLYESSNAEISYAAAVLYTPGYNANLVGGGYNVDWSGAGGFDSVGFSLY